MEQAGLASGSSATYTTFGALLKHLRRRARLTQRELGIAVGYSETQITRLEGDTRVPDPGVVRALFIDALDLQNEPQWARLLVEMAEAASGKPDDGRAALPVVQSPPTRTNLPTLLTRFIGREHELAEVIRLVGANRLVTLTGAGGSGKTRLALAAGMAVQSDPMFPDDVWLAELAPLADAGPLTQTVAAAFGLHTMSRPALAVLTDYLADRQALLILDNCEHLIGACAELAEALLRACPRLHILATSREGLNIPGEDIWRVPSLAAAESALLFAERARSAAPGFAPTERTAPVIERICARLDGIPLAIELAAARVRSLPVEQIAARLDDRFRLLTGGARTALPRQQTLRGSIDWSYDLLGEPERRLLGRLAVFAGGWELEAAEAVGAGAGVEPGDVLDLLTRLVDKSLAAAQTGEGGEVTRYGLHETIRQYAAEKLAERGEADEARRRHARYYLTLVQETAPAVMRHTGMPVQFGLTVGCVPWLRRLDAERDNLRAALAWGLREARETQDVDTGVQLALWQFVFWSIRGPRPEGREWLERALAHTDPAARPQTRARLLSALVDFVQPMGEGTAAEALAREALAICRQRGDRYDLMIALWRFADLGHVSAAERRGAIEEWLSIARGLKDARYTGIALWYLAGFFEGQHDLPRAAALYDESLAALPEDEEGLRQSARLFRGETAWEMYGGEHGLAEVHESLTYFRETGFEPGIIIVLHWLGDRALRTGDVAQARRHLREGLQVAYRDGSWATVAGCLGLLAAVAALEGQLARAVTLWAAAVTINAGVAASDERERVDAARGQLDAREAAAAEAAGHAMTLSQAVAYALQGSEADEPLAE
jgi:predicted ATPase/transcriptional regulator with XRE-family HTH domain